MNMWKLLTAVAVLLAASAIAVAQEPAATGSISGVVTIDGKPVAGIGVMVSIAKSWTDVKVVSRSSTDKEGKFSFTDLGPGEYTVLPNAPGYVINGQKRTWKPGMSVTLGEGEKLESISLVLERGGVITGRVYDANGKAVIDEEIRITPVDENGKRLPSDGWLFGSEHTDDRGIYRAYGLKPGRYVVSAGQSAEGMSRGGFSAKKAYPSTYYPGVMDEGRATPVEVSTGSEATGIDIGFGKLSQTYSATGRIVDEDGAPVAKVNVGFGSVTDGRLTGAFGFGGGSNERGEFHFSGISPGSYAAIVFPDPKNPKTASPAYFDIVDHDVSGIVITMKKGVAVSGSVVVEGPAAQNPADALQGVIVYMARPRGAGGGVETQMASKSSQVGADGTFHMAGVSPGVYQLGIFSTGKGKGLSVVRIEVGGVPTTGDLDVTADSDLSGIVLVVSSGTGSIRGHVTVTGGTLGSDRVGVGFRRADSSAREQPASIDDRGQFLIEGLAPGDYVVFVRGLSGDGPANWLLHNGKEQRVTVTNGAAAEVALTLDLEHDPTEKP